MRKLIAVAMLGAGAAFFAAAPAQAMPASGAAGIANKLATTDNAGVHEVRRRYYRHRHRGYRRGWRHRGYYGHRRYYRPRYYYGGPGYYGYRYHRRPRFGIYFGL